MHLLKRLLYARKPTTPDVTLTNESIVPPGFKVVSNASLIKRALLCIIDNAVKFTANGSVVLNASVDDDGVIFRVKDTGCGIPEGEKEKVFERFYKVDPYIPGTGLGLSLCASIAEVLGGSIVIEESTPGQGTTFSMRISKAYT